jgi:hypothetical protein
VVVPPCPPKRNACSRCDGAEQHGQPEQRRGPMRLRSLAHETDYLARRDVLDGIHHAALLVWVNAPYRRVKAERCGEAVSADLAWPLNDVSATTPPNSAGVLGNTRPAPTGRALGGAETEGFGGFTQPKCEQNMDRVSMQEPTFNRLRDQPLPSETLTPVNQTHCKTIVFQKQGLRSDAQEFINVLNCIQSKPCGRPLRIRIIAVMSSCFQCHRFGPGRRHQN